MREDDPLRQVRLAREAYGEPFGFDLDAIARDLMEKEKSETRRIVHLPPKPPEPSGIGGNRPLREPLSAEPSAWTPPVPARNS